MDGRHGGSMFTRRLALNSLLAAGCAAAAPLFAETDKTLRLGAITAGGPIAADSPRGKILIGALADLGYAPGRNLVFETRGALADFAKLPGLIEELKAGGTQILLASGYPCAAAAKAAGVPTVIFAGAGDPVATGLVESWAHPGGVITGISDLASTLTVKRLELLKAFSPQMKRVAMLWNKQDRAMALRYEASATTAQKQGLIVEPLGVREPNDFNEAFAAMDRDKPDAILMVADALRYAWALLPAADARHVDRRFRVPRLAHDRNAGRRLCREAAGLERLAAGRRRSHRHSHALCLDHRPHQDRRAGRLRGREQASGRAQDHAAVELGQGRRADRGRRRSRHRHEDAAEDHGRYDAGRQVLRHRRRNPQVAAAAHHGSTHPRADEAYRHGARQELRYRQGRSGHQGGIGNGARRRAEVDGVEGVQPRPRGERLVDEHRHHGRLRQLLSKARDCHPVRSGREP